MARNTSPILTEAELRLMNRLWDQGSGTVQELVDALPADAPLAYTTVLTTLQILERKGYVRHERDGRAYRYRPAVNQGQERRRTLRYLLDRFFDGSPELLATNLLETSDLDLDTLAQMRSRIEAKATPPSDDEQAEEDP